MLLRTQKELKLTSRQKAQLRRPRPFLFLAILAVFGLPWLLLFKTGIQARKQAAQMNQEATVFLARFPKQTQNDTARQFDRLAADLGFIPNGSADLLRINAEAAEDYSKIQTQLNQFLAAQLTKSSAPLSPLPAELSQYLSAYQPSLTTLQELLASDAPVWDVDLAQMTAVTASSPGFTNVLHVQKLLMLLALDHFHQGRTDQMLQAMESSWRLNEALSERPDLVSQLLVSLTAEQQSGLLRHAEALPPVWQETWQKRLSDRNLITRQADRVVGESAQVQLNQPLSGRSVVGGLQFSTWLQYSVLQQSLFPSTSRLSSNNASSGLRRTLSYWFSPAYYFSLRNLNTHAISQQAVETLKTLDICKTTRLEAEYRLGLEETASWNSNHLPVETLVRRWKDAGERSLSLELTQKILSAKQLAQSNEQWPATLPNLASDVCPGEYWIYERKENESVVFSFSAQLASQTIVPLHYRSGQPIFE